VLITPTQKIFPFQLLSDEVHELERPIRSPGWSVDGVSGRSQVHLYCFEKAE